MFVPYDFLGIFTGFFTNIINIIMVLIFMCVGIIVGILLRPWFGNEVIKLIDSEHRFIDLPVEEETACSITCKRKKGMPPQRFYKYAIGYIGMVGTVMKKPITRFFGKEGTAYTWSVGGNPQPIKLPLSDTMKHLWGEDFYKQIPENQMKTLEESKIQVIVDLDQGLTPKGFRSVSEEDIKTEEDREAAKTFWHGKQITERTQLVSLLITGIAGFGIACALEILGVLRINVPTTTPAPSGNQTATTTALHIIVTAVKLLRM